MTADRRSYHDSVVEAEAAVAAIYRDEHAAAAPGQNISPLGRLAYFLHREIRDAQRRLAKFEERATRDGYAYAFTWADEAVSAAAAIDVFAGLAASVAHLTNEKREPPAFVIEHIRKYAMQQALLKAQSPQRSSSTMSNLLEQGRLAAYALCFDGLSGAFEIGGAP